MILNDADKPRFTSGSAYSPVIFNCTIYSVTRNITASLSLEGIDVAFISCTEDLLLLSTSLLDLQEKFSQIIKLYISIGLEVNPTKTELLVYSNHEKQQSNCIRIPLGEVIHRSNSLRYLGVKYGCDSCRICRFIYQNVYRNVCSRYGKAVAQKNVVNRRNLSNRLNALVAPHLLYISHFWEMLTIKERH